MRCRQSVAGFVVGTVLFAAMAVPGRWADASGTDSATAGGAAATVVAEVPVLEPGLVPLVPERVLDTRNGIGCTLWPTSNASPCFPLRQRVGGGLLPIVLSLKNYVGPFTTAVSLNFTVSDPVYQGFLTVWPCGEPQPEASNLNFLAGQTVANLVVVALSEDSTVCIKSTSTTHMIADLTGVYDLEFGEPGQSVTPERLLDTRNAIGVPGRSLVPADGVVSLQVAGRGRVPTGAHAVSMNLTAATAVAAGFVTVWPCDAPRPNSSNLNFTAGGTRPNLVIVALSEAGTACVYTSAGVHLLADVGTWFGDAGSSGFVELNPSRILDTRNGIGAPRSKLGPNGVLTLQVHGRGGVDSDADSVVMNVTATRTEAAGFVTVWPCDAARPDVSNLNFAAGETNPNLVSVRLSAAGTVCLFASAMTDLLADVAGFMTSTPISVGTLQ